jgi:hypothetical protein
MKDDRSRAFAVLLALFLIGLIIGVGGSYLYFKPSRNMPGPFDRGRFPQPQAQNGQRAGIPKPGIPEELNLTPEQLKKWDEILKETNEKMETLRNEWEKYNKEIWDSQWAPKVKEIWAENESKARAALNGDQKVKYDIWIEKVHKYMERMGQRMPRRRGSEMPMDNRPMPKRSPTMPFPGPLPQ